MAGNYDAMRAQIPPQGAGGGGFDPLQAIQDFLYNKKLGPSISGEMGNYIGLIPIIKAIMNGFQQPGALQFIQHPVDASGGLPAGQMPPPVPRLPPPTNPMRAYPPIAEGQGGLPPGATAQGAGMDTAPPTVPDDILQQLGTLFESGVESVGNAADQALPQVTGVLKRPIPPGDEMTPQRESGYVPVPTPDQDPAQKIADDAIAADSGADDTSGAVDTEDAADTASADEVAGTAATDEADAVPDTGSEGAEVPSAEMPYPDAMPSDRQPPMTDMSNKAIADFINSMMGGDTGTPADGSIVNPDRAGYGQGPAGVQAKAMGAQAKAIHAPIVNVDVGTKEPSHQPKTRGYEAGDPTKAYVQKLAAGETPDVVSRGGRIGRAPRGEQLGGANKIHTIAKGESLYKIAQRMYGDPNRWREIARANKLSVRNPNKIFTGQTLVIPGAAGGPTPRERPVRYTDKPNTEGGSYH